MSLFLLFYAFENPWADWTHPATLGLAFSSQFGPEAMVIGTLGGILLAFICFPYRRVEENAFRVFVSGIRALLVPIFILVAAWILGGVISGLGTADYLTRVLEGRLHLAYVGGMVFLTGALISFSTGTSWGTMAILMPLAVPAVISIGRAAGLEDGDLTGQLSLVIAAVFSGAVFGDHCSPFSDTTIVSSIACGVEPEEHVRTQIPFALVAGLVALVIGFLPAGMGMNPLIVLLVGVLFLWSMPLWLQRYRGFPE
jgi:Na+/H+ antiporter NhaC